MCLMISSPPAVLTVAAVTAAHWLHGTHAVHELQDEVLVVAFAD